MSKKSARQIRTELEEKIILPAKHALNNGQALPIKLMERSESGFGPGTTRDDCAEWLEHVSKEKLESLLRSLIKKHLPGLSLEWRCTGSGFMFRSYAWVVYQKKGLYGAANRQG